MSLSVKSFYGNKTYVPPHLRKKPLDTGFHSDFDSSDVEDDAEPDEAIHFQRNVHEENTIDSDSDSETESEIESDESSSSSFDDVPLANLATSNVKGLVQMTKEKTYRWRKRKPLLVDSTFRGDPLPPPPFEEYSPYKYFKRFFDDALISHLVEQTNLYSVQESGHSINVTKEEMEKYLAILMFAAAISLPTIRGYWEAGTRVPFVADLMPVNRFEKIRQYFHCNDNTQTPAERDKLFKVRPVIESVLEKCKQVPMEEFQSIDEQIIPTKGRSGLRQYLPKKPNKWGIKVWARCSKSGIVHQFEVYTGKGSTENHDPSLFDPSLLMGGNVVTRLLTEVPKRQNYKVFFDNFFSSIPLMENLKQKGYLAAATLRKDRLKGAAQHMEKESQLKKRGRGSSDYVVEANSGLTIVRWYDNKMVQLISNYLTNTPGNDARRWSKKTKEFIIIDRPNIVEVYNANMGGVDLCDMLLSCYRIRRRTNKHYLHIFYYSLGISVTNAWLPYKRHQNQQNVAKKHIMPLLNFHMEIAKGLAFVDKPVQAVKRGRPSLDNDSSPASRKGRKAAEPDPSNEMRKDKVDHFPEFKEKQGRC